MTTVQCIFEKKVQINRILVNLVNFIEIKCISNEYGIYLNHNFHASVIPIGVENFVWWLGQD